MHLRKGMFHRFQWKTEVALAVMPTVMVIAVLMLLEAFSKQQLLFGSLASSAFLIYLDPKHPTNSIRTLFIAQISAAIIGYLVYLLVGPGYGAAALSMVLVVVLMIVTKAMHPPAVATSLLFAFQYTKPNTLMLFLFAIVLLIILVALQRASIWLIKRSDLKDKNKVPDTPKDL